MCGLRLSNRAPSLVHVNSCGFKAGSMLENRKNAVVTRASMKSVT